MLKHKEKLSNEEFSSDVVEIKKEDGFFISGMCHDLRLRSEIYQMLLKAREHLPYGYNFMIVEAYRTLARQQELWDAEYKAQQEKHPKASDEEILEKTRVLVANPKKGGGGHQTGCAIDLTLCRDNGEEFDMGTAVQEFSEKTETNNDLITEEQRYHRNVLQEALENAGFVNYPTEWWHYCYGDSLWSRITGTDSAIFINSLDLN